MRGNIKAQVLHIYRDSGIDQQGNSKLDARQQAAAELRAEGKQVNNQAIGARTGLHGRKTAASYLKSWREVLRDQEAEHGKANADKLTAQDVERFLADKIDQGLSRGYVQKLCSSLAKMEQALNKLAENEGKEGRHDWQGALAEARSRAQNELEKNHYDRSYRDPQGLIENLKRDDHKIVAKMQLEGGARVAEASKIHARQLAGIHETRQGEQVGVILVKNQAKGGKPRVITVSPETYEKIANHIQERGKLSVDYEGYRRGLMDAADKTGQHKLIELKNDKTGKKEPVHDWGGTHGLRYNYAQNSYKAHIEAGKSHEATLLKVSYEMGHNRAEITTRYLG